MKPTRSSARLGHRYAAHNASRGHEFIYGGTQRVEALKLMLPGVVGDVLDLGCRDGALLEALGLQRTRAVGIDIDIDALHRAAESGRVLPSATNLWEGLLPFRSAAFDIVLAGEILEHLPFPDTVVGEVARVLRQDGIFLGSVPNAFRLKNRLLFLAGRPFEQDPTHLRYFSPEELAGLLRRYFPQVHVQPCVGRAARVWPRMTANDLVWKAVNG